MDGRVEQHIATRADPFLQVQEQQTDILHARRQWDGPLPDRAVQSVRALHAEPVVAARPPPQNRVHFAPQTVRDTHLQTIEMALLKPYSSDLSP